MGSCCEHPTSDSRGERLKVLRGGGDGQRSDAPSAGAATLTEYDARRINPVFPPSLAECSNKQHKFLLEQ